MGLLDVMHRINGSNKRGFIGSNNQTKEKAEVDAQRTGLRTLYLIPSYFMWVFPSWYGTRLLSVSIYFPIVQMTRRNVFSLLYHPLEKS